MALELVAGPFPLQTIADVAVVDFSPDNSTCAYSDAIGMFGYSTAMDGMCIIQLDGTVCLRGKPFGSSGFALDLQTPDGFLIHDTPLDDGLRKFYPASMTTDIDAIFEAEAIGFVGGVRVRCEDRYLTFNNGSVQFKPLDLSGAWTTECVLIPTLGSSVYRNVSRTKKKNILAIVYDTGEIILYDHILKVALASHSYIGANSAAWYSPKYDIYVAINTDDTVSVYSNEVRPYTLSDATVVTPLVRGQVSRVKVQLLGSNLEPCVGELVNWSITGAGALLETQSATDADGYAWNDCVVAPSATVAAAIEITAEMLF